MRNFTKMLLAVSLLTVFAFGLHAQSVGINSNGSSPNSTVCSEAVLKEKQATGIY
jgi:hypothetical protein